MTVESELEQRIRLGAEALALLSVLRTLDAIPPRQRAEVDRILDAFEACRKSSATRRQRKVRTH